MSSKNSGIYFWLSFITSLQNIKYFEKKKVDRLKRQLKERIEKEKQAIKNKKNQQDENRKKINNKKK